MSIEHDLLQRMFEDDLALARGLMAIKDYAMAAETLARAIDKIHQIAAIARPCESTASTASTPSTTPIDI